MARKKTKTKPIDSYSHAEAERVNNPPVGLVDAANDPDAGAKSYRHVNRAFAGPPADDAPSDAETAAAAGPGPPGGTDLRLQAPAHQPSFAESHADDEQTAEPEASGQGSGGGSTGRWTLVGDAGGSEGDDSGGQADGPHSDASDSEPELGDNGEVDGEELPGGEDDGQRDEDDWRAAMLAGAHDHDPHIDPELSWAQKHARSVFDVPTVSLHVHERIDPQTIMKAVRKRGGGENQGSLFEQPSENRPLREAVEFYKHRQGWANRLIAGDSLQVMNSLLEKEGMGGEVQTVYLDPPYGIKYGSNFQPFTGKREVKDTASDLTREPEMIRAFRDTWEMGIHSYLSHMRDRLMLARDLLNYTGSCFVQIGDENVHRVAMLMDEVFGAANRCATISFATTSGSSTKRLPEVADYLLWYAKDIEQVKYRQLYGQLDRAGIVDLFTPYAGMVELPDGSSRRLSPEERFDPDKHLPSGSRLWKATGLTSQGRSATGRSDPFEWRGCWYRCPETAHWAVSHAGLQRMADKGRLFAYDGSEALHWKRYEDEVPGRRINNLWHRQRYPSDKRYVVQTARSVIERCLLMTSDPGDLVLDPTCGSGTTAYVAEQWGRRWISCDTSRVALALARHRLMTATFPYYTLAHPLEGVDSGFTYRTVPKVSAASLAYDEPPQVTTLYDQPFVDKGKHRVSGPFNVEAVPSPVVIDPSRISELDHLAQPAAGQPAASPHALSRTEADAGRGTDRGADGEEGACPPPAAGSAQVPGTDHGPEGHQGETAGADPELEHGGDADPVRLTPPATPPADSSVGRQGESARQTRWTEQLLASGIRGKRQQRINFTRLEPLASPHVHAEGEVVAEGTEQHLRAAVVFGPEHAPLEQRRVERGIEEARNNLGHLDVLVFAAFAFDPEAAKDIDESNLPGLVLHRVNMNTDLQTDDLKTKAKGTSDDLFWLVGRPEVSLQGLKNDRWKVKVLGFDYFDVVSGERISGGASQIAAWMLDTDYDGRALFPRQVFFPADPKKGWQKLGKTLNSSIDPTLIKRYEGTVSLPFDAGDKRRIAVKIIDDRGIESLVVQDLPDPVPPPAARAASSA